MPRKLKKIRFGKRDFKGLNRFPSAQEGKGIPFKTRRYKRSRLHGPIRIMRGVFLGFLALVLLLFVVLKVGISGQILANQMQAILSTQLHNFADVKINDARLSLDSNLHVALEARNVQIGDLDNGIKIDNVASFKLGLSLWQIMRGKIDVQQLEMQGARITLPRSDNGPSLWEKLPKNADGQVDMDQMQAFLFNGLDSALFIFDRQVIHRLLIKDVSLIVPSAGDSVQEISVNTLSAENFQKGLVVSTQFNVGQGPITAKGIITRNYQRKTASFEFKAKDFPARIGAGDNASAFLPGGHTNNMFFRLKGVGAIELSGERTTAMDSRSSLYAAFTVTDGFADIGTETGIPATFNVGIEHIERSGKIALLPSEFNIGGLHLPLEGSIGIVRAEEKKQLNDSDYQFELFSKKAISAPADSPEKPLNFDGYFQGDFNVDAKKLNLNTLEVLTSGGQLNGKGSLRFGDGSPEMNFLLQTEKLDTTSVKQLWPANISPGGRRWVHAHISGGQLMNGSIKIALPLGFFQKGVQTKELSGNEVKVFATLNDTSTDTYAELPRLDDINATILIEGQKTTVKLVSGVATLKNGRQVKAREGTLVIPWGTQRPVYADLDIILDANIKTAGDVLHLKPVAVSDKLPFNPEEAEGDIDAAVKLHFPVTRDGPPGKVTWKSDVNFKNLTLNKPLNGSTISKGAGLIRVSNDGAHLTGTGNLDVYPATFDVMLPFDGSSIEKHEKITLLLDDELREKNAAFLNTFLTGPIAVEVGANINGVRHINADLTNATLAFPWVGWKKGKGVSANAEFDMPSDFATRKNYAIRNFAIKGANINLAGEIQVENKQLKSANFKTANLNRDDHMALSITYENKTYVINAEGAAYDARSLIKNLGSSGGSGPSGDQINFRANIKKIIGFNNEAIFDVAAAYESKGRDSDLAVNAATGNGSAIIVNLGSKAGHRYANADSADAGVLLRFMDYYDKLHNGALTARLSGDANNNALNGPVTIRKFLIIDEPRLATLVANTPSNRGPNPNNPQVMTSRIPFDVAFAELGKGDNYLVVDRGILRGPSVGASFQGVIYDSSGNMELTGTFMPAYGLNRIFGSVPVLGQILGNGRDGGLIGITFKIVGSIKAPRVIVNPVSAIAPGIFRQIFEFQ